MKHIFKVGTLIVSIMFFSACGTSSVYVNSVLPAQISIPEHINHIGVANRSLAGKGDRIGNVLEGLFSGEEIGADREASEQCIIGMVEMTNRIGLRLSATQIFDESLTGTGRDVMKAPLAASRVDSICKLNKIDALLVLESFDSDSRTLAGSPIRRTKKIKDRKVEYLEYPAELFLDITAGWRIYENTKHTIVDQNTFVDGKKFASTGNSEAEAIDNLPRIRKALKDAGYYAGEQYARRVNPVNTRLARTYFTKAKKVDDFKVAKSYVKNNNWDEAIAIWKKHVEHSEKKVRGRAAFNMALASEVQGSFSLSMTWAEKAQKEGISLATSYLIALKQRVRNEQLVKEQLYED
jgi:hypothetical protein